MMTIILEVPSAVADFWICVPGVSIGTVCNVVR